MLLGLLSLFLSAVNANAASVPKLLVIIDPGHGGSDTGAITHRDGDWLFEKDITLKLARQTQAALRARGIASVLTRSDDRFVGLDRRTELANQASARAQTAVFVSIHANSSENSQYSGAEVYVFNATNNEASRRLADLENGKRFAQSHAPLQLILSDLATTANYGESVNLARSIEKSTHSLAIHDRGVRQALFYVLMETRMPGILFEPGFVSNPDDLAHLLSPTYQRRLARGLAEGIARWRKPGRVLSKN